MNSYELSRNWFDWCFENTDIVTPTHTALYFFAIEHCNRLGWKDKFGFPTSMAMEAIGIKNYRTFSKALNDLIEWKFISISQRSKNQYSSNVIGIVKNTKAKSKALDKALQSHGKKQNESTACINKPNNKKTINVNAGNPSFDELNENNTPLSPSLDFSGFDNEDIKKHWGDWIEYRNDEKKGGFKSLKTEQTALNSLAALSKGLSWMAKLIIEQSISSGYKGLFELKYKPEPPATQQPENPQDHPMMKFRGPTEW